MKRLLLRLKKAFAETETPAGEKLGAVWEPLEAELNQALENLNQQKEAGEISEDKFNSQAETLQAEFKQKLEPALEEYRAVVRPARQKYLEAAQAAVAAYKSTE